MNPFISGISVPIYRLVFTNVLVIYYKTMPF